MEVNLSIKGVPAAWADCLRQRAERNHRSLQGELMALLEQAVRASAGPAGSSTGAFVTGEPLLGGGPGVLRRGGGNASADRVQWKLRGSRSIETLAAQRQVQPLGAADGLPRASDIVRQARDARGS